MKNAQIENTDAVQLIRACNNPDCLIYADPPYLCETRKRKRIYRVEMLTTAAHIELLDALLAHEGPVILSGYDHQGLPRYVLGHTQSGDWINVSRDLLRLIIESASGGQLRGQLIYTERYL